MVILLTNSARAEDLYCEVKANTESILAKSLTLPTASTARLVQFNGFVVKITNLDKAQFEIEVFDPNVPSRSYANGFLHSSTDELKLSLWSENILLEAKCKLAMRRHP